MRCVLRKIILCGIFAAIGIILGRSFMTVYITPAFKITFDKIPVILAGLWLGPLYGAAVAAVADIVGASMLSSFGWTPLLTVSPVLMGVISGFLGMLVKKPDEKPYIIMRTCCVVILTEALTSVLLQTYFLTLLYGGTYAARLVARAPVSALVSVCETAVIAALELSGPVSTSVRKLIGSGGKNASVKSGGKKSGGEK